MDESGVQTIGVVLLVATSVVAVGAPAAYLAFSDGVSAPAVTAYDVGVAAGADGAWGTGDESVTVAFAAGQQLSVGELQVLVRTSAGDTVVEGAALGPDPDAPFAAAGADWVHPVTLQRGEAVHVEIVLQRPFQEILVQQEDLTVGTDVHGGIGAPGGAGGQGGGQEQGESEEEGEEEGEEEEGGGFVICHIPPGNPGNAHTITVGSQNAVNAHLGHGDHEGPCE